VLRDTLLQKINRPRPGDCWVSYVCFLPQQGHEVLSGMLQTAAKRGKGTLHFWPNTIIKSLQTSPTGNENQNITRLQGIQHRPAPGTAPVNTDRLSQIWDDLYTETDSARFHKTRVDFTPPPNRPWMVIEATETGELLAIADVPYRVGVDPRSHRNPSSSAPGGYPYCTQAFTYTFAMEATAQPQTTPSPPFYKQYEPFYSYDQPRYGKNPKLVFTYRRIWSTKSGAKDTEVNPGDISMQNWGGGNDYTPGTPRDNFLSPGTWNGGLRVSSLKGGEELALGYFYWLTNGTTDSKLGAGIKQPWPNLRYLQGLESPMGTAHGLSKFPYIRESRRMIGRPGYAYPRGFGIDEVDVSRANYREPYYTENLSGTAYRDLFTIMAGLKTLDVITDKLPIDQVKLRARARIFPDSVGIGHYPIDFHPCYTGYPPEKPGNQERPGERQGAERTYPYQIPLRAMIPQRIDNLLVAGKAIATSHISSATYRVHSFEWSSGAAAGTTAVFALEQGIAPFQLVESVPRTNEQLEALQRRLVDNGNPIAFPGTSIFNEDWKGW
jgi:FAD dependent oxidoreductase